MINGPAAAPYEGDPPPEAAALEAAFRGIVVVRGSGLAPSAYRPDGHIAPGFNVALTRALRAAAGGTPVVLQGSVVDVAAAQQALDDGVADAVEMTRAQIADADLVRKTRAGVPVRPCTLCNQACQVRDVRNPLVSCVADPSGEGVLPDGARMFDRLSGPELLAYQDDDGAWVDVKSADIKASVKQVTGGDFTAKDFRTWSATVLAAVAMASSFPQARSKTARARAISRAVQEVAHYLGNTPAVCRASYIDPRVFDRYRSGLTIAAALEQLGEVTELGEPAHQGAIEEAVLDLIEEKHGPAPELDLIA